MIKPITPSEVGEVRKKTLPEAVVATWNRLIGENWDGNQSKVFQNEVVLALMDAMDVDRQTVFDRKWLDIEFMYRDAGWRVAYDKPAYNETGQAHFIFTKK